MAELELDEHPLGEPAPLDGHPASRPPELLSHVLGGVVAGVEGGVGVVVVPLLGICLALVFEPPEKYLF